MVIICCFKESIKSVILVLGSRFSVKVKSAMLCCINITKKIDRGVNTNKNTIKVAKPADKYSLPLTKVKILLWTWPNKDTITKATAMGVKNPNNKWATRARLIIRQTKKVQVLNLEVGIPLIYNLFQW